MSTTETMKPIAKMSPRLRARMAGAFFLMVLLTAASTEFFFRGKLNFAADLAAEIIEVSCYLSVTVLFYFIFMPVSRNLALLAMSCNLVGLIFEALQWNPRGVVIGMVFHGFYCLLFGYLIFRSTFLPRILGVPFALAGLCWLTYLSPALANYLSPYHLAFGLIGEALVCLWLLIMSVNTQRWNAQASAAQGRS